MRETRVYSIPMPIRFRGITVRQGMLIRGEAGWGEWSPFEEYGPREAATWLRAALEAADEGYPEPVRFSIPVNATIPAVDPPTARKLAVGSGCATAKIKVAEPGQSLDDDIARVEAVRDGLGPKAKIRVDANGGWDFDQAEKAVKSLAKYDLEYVEQPCAAVEDLAKLRRKVDVPIAADESIRRAEDPYLVKKLEAADVAVLKVQPLGGVRACLRLAEELDMDVVVSSAVETSVGLRAGIALAAALPRLPYACGLGTLPLLSADVVSDPLTCVNGQIPVRPVHVDPALVDRVQADEETIRQWTVRLDVSRRAALLPWEGDGDPASGRMTENGGTPPPVILTQSGSPSPDQPSSRVILTKSGSPSPDQPSSPVILTKSGSPSPNPFITPGSPCPPEEHNNG